MLKESYWFLNLELGSEAFLASRELPLEKVASLDLECLSAATCSPHLLRRIPEPFRLV